MKALKQLSILAVADNQQRYPNIPATQQEEDSDREFRIMEFVKAAWMLSGPIGTKALNIAAERLYISPYKLVSLIAGYSSRPTLSIPKNLKMPDIPCGHECTHLNHSN